MFKCCFFSLYPFRSYPSVMFLPNLTCKHRHILTHKLLATKLRHSCEFPLHGTFFQWKRRSGKLQPFASHSVHWKHITWAHLCLPPHMSAAMTDGFAEKIWPQNLKDVCPTQQKLDVFSFSSPQIKLTLLQHFCFKKKMFLYLSNLLRKANLGHN